MLATLNQLTNIVRTRSSLQRKKARGTSLASTYAQQGSESSVLEHKDSKNGEAETVDQASSEGSSSSEHSALPPPLSTSGSKQALTKVLNGIQRRSSKVRYRENMYKVTRLGSRTQLTHATHARISFFLFSFPFFHLSQALLKASDDAVERLLESLTSGDGKDISGSIDDLRGALKDAVEQRERERERLIDEAMREFHV